MAIDNILYQNTASFEVLNATDGSGVLGVISASHALVADSLNGTVTTADTASYVAGANVDGAVASATSASHASNADSASIAVSATSASHAEQADSALAADTATSASHALNADQAISASYAAAYAEMPKYKSGVVAGASFGGAPLTASVAFATSFDDTNYSVNIGSGASRNWTIESITSAGFVISTNSGQSLGSDTAMWTAMAHGESD